MDIPDDFDKTDFLLGVDFLTLCIIFTPIPLAIIMFNQTFLVLRIIIMITQILTIFYAMKDLPKNIAFMIFDYVSFSLEDRKFIKGFKTIKKRKERRYRK